MAYEVPHFINGKKVSVTTRKLNIYNPASGQVAGFVNVADKALLAQALASANAAFPAWSNTPAQQRAKIIFRFKTLLENNLEELAKLVTEEHGKTLAEAIGSVQRGLEVVSYACGIPNLLKGTFAETVAADMDAYSLHQPLGVCVGITPFNFPAMIPLWMLTMATACGNTFILKPSEKDPSCPLRIVELAHEAGFPPGVINLIQGDKEAVDALLCAPEVKAVSFVGSTPVAEYVYKTAIANNKRAQAFGGAKNHCIIMPDADLEMVSDVLIEAAYGSAGERCMALSVALLVGDSLADNLISKMLPKIKQLKIGPGMQANTSYGPLVTNEHRERVLSYVALGKKEGATLLADHSMQIPTDCGKGFFMGPCLFDHVLPTMRIYREEIFGPVLCLVRVKTFAEALELINAHEFGNGTAIFTRDGYVARQFAEKVQVGMVGINVPIPVPVAYHSFGGWKRSIFSDIGMYGSEAIRFYTKWKTVTARWYP